MALDSCISAKGYDAQVIYYGCDNNCSLGDRVTGPVPSRGHTAAGWRLIERLDTGLQHRRNDKAETS